MLWTWSECSGRKNLGIFGGAAWELAGRARKTAETSIAEMVLLQHGSLHTVVDAIADVHIEPPWLTEQGFVLR